MKVYSPSSTTKYLRCSLMNWLEHQYEPRVMGRPALARILGTAIGVGVADHYTNRQAKAGLDPIETAIQSAKVQLEDAANRGLVIHPDQEGDATTLPSLAAKGITKFIERDPIPLTWEIISVEQDLGPAYGNCRPDLLVRLPHGELMVVDLKTKRTLEARWLDRTLQEYRNSWQMKHYCWSVGETYDTDVYQYNIMLVVLEPTFKVILDPTITDEEMLARWFRNAKRVWGEMEKEELGLEYPYEAAEHYDRYGRCPWYQACFEYHLEPTLMDRDYIRRNQ